MLTDLYYIGNAPVVGTFALENFEVVVVVDLARCIIVSYPVVCIAKEHIPSQERCTE